MLTQEELEGIRGRCEAATPGIWTRSEYRPGGWIIEHNQGLGIVARSENLSSADFIADAHQAIPALLANIAELTRERDEAREENEDYRTLEPFAYADVYHQLRQELKADDFGGVIQAVDVIRRERGELRTKLRAARRALRFYVKDDLYRISGACIGPDDGSRGDALLAAWDLIDDGGLTAREGLRASK